jgi:nucleoid-associated protein YgaU
MMKEEDEGKLDRTKDQAQAIKVKAMHKVESGETLSHLALHYYGHATKPYYMLIYEANKALIGDDPNRVKVGLTLKIPELPVDMAKG